MATADQFKALIRSYAEGDSDRFYSIALQVAAQAARQGHTKFAVELRQLIDTAKLGGPARHGQHARPVPMVRPRGELAGLLTASYPRLHVRDMVLEQAILDRIDRVILEQSQRAKLREYGLSPIRRLLLVGPPGTGKTMTASVLATELSTPLFTIQLDGLITKYLGETAAKLRLIFDAIQETRAVYLFDEFDALGAERAVKNEVGEIRRILNSFLQFLESDDSDSIVVAATNHPQLLDRALFRRFDLAIEYDLPSIASAERIIRERLAPFDISEINWTIILENVNRLSQADLVRACEIAAKNLVLGSKPRLTTEELVKALEERRPAPK